MGNLFLGSLSFSLGNGLRAKFWVDPWVEGKCRLMDRCLSLFELSLQKKESVGTLWDGESESWVFRWGREFNPNEFIEFLDLWQCIHRYRVRVNVKDSWRWHGSSKGKFTTKEMYDVIVEAEPGEDVNVFPWKKLWWKAAPAKVSAFAWKTIRERLATKDNLLKRGICDGVGTGACSMCLGPTKSSNHLLFSCPVALLVWQAVCSWLDKPLIYSFVCS